MAMTVKEKAIMVSEIIILLILAVLLILILNLKLGAFP